MNKEFENELEEDFPTEYGTKILAWEVDEYPAHERSTAWYVVGGLASFGFIIYGLATLNFLFALIILMLDIIFLLSIFKKPDRIPVVLSTTGVLIGNGFYDYRVIKDFSVVYNPPHVKYLYLDFHSSWRPLLSVPLEEIDPNEVREALLEFCMENLERDEESLTDILRRVYKL